MWTIKGLPNASCDIDLVYPHLVVTSFEMDIWYVNSTVISHYYICRSLSFEGYRSILGIDYITDFVAIWNIYNFIPMNIYVLWPKFLAHS